MIRALSGRDVVAGALAVVVLVAAPSTARAVHQGLTLEVAPESDRNPTGGQHRLTATISAPAPVPQLEVHFEIVSGPNAVQGGEATADDFSLPDFTCIITAEETDPSCFVDYTDGRSPAGGVTDTIVAWIDHDPRQALVSFEGLDRLEPPDAGEPPHEPGTPRGPEGDIREPDSTDVVVKHWGQLGASRRPYLDGELEQLASNCRRSVARSGTVSAGVARRCNLLFALSPAAEEDAGRNYYVVWMQAEATPSRGWCATRAETRLALPTGARVVSVAAPRARVLKQTRLLRTTLSVSAAGLAFEPGFVEQSAFYRPGTLRLRRSRSEVRLVWQGRSRQAVAFAVGAQISLPAGSRPAVGTLNRIEARFARAPC
jgi:hypothetical protein